MNVANMSLAGYLLPSNRAMRVLWQVLLVLVGSLLLWVSAKIKVDLPLVPITLQSLVVLTLGAAYGWRLGMATVLLYLAEGAWGIPVFAGTPERGIGLAYMMGPTGGYLVGFLLAAGLVGWLAQRGADRNAFRMFGAMLAGMAVIWLCGLVWLFALKSVVTGTPVTEAFFATVSAGLLPFIAGDLIKAALAAMAFPAAWLLVDRR
jgi:biotin transport system substrate-specific component